MRVEQRFTLGFGLIIVILAVGSCVYYAMENAKCEDRGGVYVRGAWGMKCVQEMKPIP